MICNSQFVLRRCSVKVNKSTASKLVTFRLTTTQPTTRWRTTSRHLQRRRRTTSTSSCRPSDQSTSSPGSPWLRSQFIDSRSMVVITADGECSPTCLLYRGLSCSSTRVCSTGACAAPPHVLALHGPVLPLHTCLFYRDLSCSSTRVCSTWACAAPAHVFALHGPVLPLPRPPF